LGGCLISHKKHQHKQEIENPCFHRLSARASQCLNQATHWQSYSQSIDALSIFDFDVRQIISGRVVFGFGQRLIFVVAETAFFSGESRLYFG
jgi:hypothetical protein